MKTSVVMVITKSGLSDIFEELLDEIIAHKILIRVMEDSEFETYLKGTKADE